MPAYDYKCKECESVITITHSINEPAREHEAHTDDNGGPCDGPLKRLIATGTGFTFEGGTPTPRHYN